ncbi:two-component system sensor histidine kinase CssS [Gracilibacillus halophilus YIM-C55.5]|uniref:histidine kinase n=1 Tax=Gracilibacillus halophilus YIM-C55.5 TaxID=1308866 RepID=N4W7X6_9BACI|nr:HAMP domain-containing sensor histidine kinase [Gracilibacillus halophilus]ENH96373.1 two-component system sensor histidine kinase CssS [Gracilibacillus halophilus YIM-C55.5]
MKLQYQLTLAFTTLLMVIMTVAGVLIYSQMLQMLIDDEQRQLEDNGQLIVNFILSQDLNNSSNAQQLLSLLDEFNLQVFAYDETSDSIIFSSMPNIERLDYWVDRYELDRDDQPLWEANDNKYVVSIIPFSSQQLVLLTPLDDLQAVQENFIRRMVLIFFIGLAVAVFLSHYLTKRLVTPLTKLRHQLKKIEKRQFDQMEEISATGEIKEVERSVRDMANELNSFIQSQRQFFQNASHELKTPLMTIQGYAEGIKDGVFEAEEAERGHQVMVDEIKRLKKIINEMILLAKLESEAEHYEEETVSLSAILQQVEDRAMPIANDQKVKLELHQDNDYQLWLDQDKMLQAIMNIVTNAIRHANQTVELRAYKQNQKAVIEISDDGKGIDEDLLSKLFHRFVKGKSGESGLGLAIARAIIEQSGGTISASNREGSGAAFTITFDLTK